LRLVTLGWGGFGDTDSPFFIHGQDFADFTAFGTGNETFCITFGICFSQKARSGGNLDALEKVFAVVSVFVGRSEKTIGVEEVYYTAVP
jgi:hypothetical protein|tara:strand:- start:237 stop:503 length:267 start_codon:yes stop_codon:yes gene_type:complete